MTEGLDSDLHRRVLELMDQAFCIVELIFDGRERAVDYRFLEANSAFEIHTGLRNAVGKRMRELAPMHEEHWFEIYGSVALTGKPARFINEATQLEGRWFDVNAFRVGKPEDRRVAIVFTDITERKRAQDRLRESEHHLRLVTDNAPILISYVDPQLVYRFGNAAYMDWFGRDPRDVPVRELLGEEVFRHREPYLRRALAGERVQFEGPMHRLGFGPRDAELTFVPDRAESGAVRGVYVFVADVTDRNRAGLAMRAMRDELAGKNAELEQRVLERTARLRETIGELEQFSYTLTHDMRAPLRAMQAFGELLRDGYDARLDDTGRDYLGRIIDSAGRMDSLITDALSYSKVVREELTLEPVDSGALLRGILYSYPQFHPPNADVDVIGRLPWVIGSRAGLTQCFSNYLSNAVKFMEPGKKPRVRIWAERRDATVRFWFEDNGIGIPRDQQRQLFVMFQRLSKQYEGTGIGLALVRKVAERMKGAVGVVSEPGAGSRFWIELPAAHP